MTDEIKPDAEMCSNCRHYLINPENVKQGVCRLDPPDSFPVPGRQMQGVVNVTLMMVPRQVPHDWLCGQYESASKPNEDPE